MRRIERICYGVGDLTLAIRNVALLNFLLFFFPLTRKSHAEIHRELEARRAVAR